MVLVFQPSLTFKIAIVTEWLFRHSVGSKGRSDPCGSIGKCLRPRIGVVYISLALPAWMIVQSDSEEDVLKLKRGSNIRKSISCSFLSPGCNVLTFVQLEFSSELFPKGLIRDYSPPLRSQPTPVPEVGREFGCRNAFVRVVPSECKYLPPSPYFSFGNIRRIVTFQNRVEEEVLTQMVKHCANNKSANS